jgi:hypothetical protein
VGAWYTLWCISIYGHLHFCCSTGVPVTWMMASSGMEIAIQFFKNFIKDCNPEIKLQITMSDCNQAEMNAIKAVYLEMKLLLCWWHVLCTMQTHFCMEEFLELWKCIQEWVKTSDQSTIDSIWEWIQTDELVPQSFVDYLQNNWMGIVPLWAGILRHNQTIYQEGDTNILIEV